MNKAILALLFLIHFSLFAQKPCVYTTNVTDSLGTYRETKECMMYERNFAGNASYVFFSLVSDNTVPMLNLKIIKKSKDFMKANCFDKNSKLYLQLNNGKIITLIHTDQNYCGTMVRDEKGFDNRILSGTFLFLKGSIEDLNSSPVYLMRLKYATDAEDYVIKKEFISEMNNQTYQPETFFMDNLECVVK